MATLGEKRRRRDRILLLEEKGTWAFEDGVKKGKDWNPKRVSKMCSALKRGKVK